MGDIEYAIELRNAITKMIVTDRLPSRGRHVSPADIHLVVRQIKEALKVSPDGTIDVTMGYGVAQLFIDFLYDWDPDMPPRPICKILGPLVGDTMMNEKLNRLDELADKLGPIVLLLSGLVTSRTPR